MSGMDFLERLLGGAEVEWKELGELTEIKTGQSVNKSMIANNPGDFPVINSGREPLGFINKWNTYNEPLGITTRGAGVGSVTWQEGKYYRGNLNYSLSIKDSCKVMERYLYHILLKMRPAIHALCTFDGIPALNAGNLKKLQIPIPCPENPKKSLEIQTKIVRILDSMTALTAELTAELTARKKQYNYYRDQLLSFEEGEVTWKTLGDAVEIQRGRRLVKSQLEESGDFAVFQNSMTPLGYYHESNVEPDSAFIICAGAAGEIGYSAHGFWAADDVHYFRPPEGILSKFLYHWLLTQQNQISGQVRRASIPRLSKSVVEKLSFPIPCPEDPKKSLAEQARIVSILDKFDVLTTSLSEGLPREIELRQKQYEYYRDLLLSFPKQEKGSQ